MFERRLEYAWENERARSTSGQSAAFAVREEPATQPCLKLFLKNEHLLFQLARSPCADMTAIQKSPSIFLGLVARLALWASYSSRLL
jgi:hypothetical protein